jgi:hypothetical protein
MLFGKLSYNKFIGGLPKYGNQNARTLRVSQEENFHYGKYDQGGIRSSR